MAEIKKSDMFGQMAENDQANLEKQGDGFTFKGRDNDAKYKQLKNATDKDIL